MGKCEWCGEYIRNFQTKCLFCGHIKKEKNNVKSLEQLNLMTKTNLVNMILNIKKIQDKESRDLAYNEKMKLKKFKLVMQAYKLQKEKNAN